MAQTSGAVYKWLSAAEVRRHGLRHVAEPVSPAAMDRSSAPGGQIPGLRAICKRSGPIGNENIQRSEISDDTNPSQMKTPDKVELGIIAVAILLVGTLGRFLPSRLRIGEVLAIGCLTWLVQGGVRDLWLLYLLKTRPTTAPRRRLACMCLESSAGMAGLIVGIGLTLCGFGGELQMTPMRWMLLAAGVFALGFVLKDFVISWRPLGLRRDPDHHSIIFTWW
jgi:hypothetical protein